MRLIPFNPDGFEIRDERSKNDGGDFTTEETDETAPSTGTPVWFREMRPVFRERGDAVETENESGEENWERWLREVSLSQRM